MSGRNSSLGQWWNAGTACLEKLLRLIWFLNKQIQCHENKHVEKQCKRKRSIKVLHSKNKKKPKTCVTKIKSVFVERKNAPPAIMINVIQTITVIDFVIYIKCLCFVFCFVLYFLFWYVDIQHLKKAGSHLVPGIVVIS